jgi:group I intron endonuclease
VVIGNRALSGNPMTQFCAYLVTNQETGKQYVGIVGRNGKTIAARWKEHCNKSDRRSGHLYLHRAIRKHGRQVFTVEHIASALSWDDLCATERSLILQYGTRAPAGYNMTGGGQGAFNPTEETRAKLRLTVWKPGVPRSAEIRAKLSAACMGRKLSAETIAKIRAKTIGQTRSTETKQAIASALEGKKRPPEFGQRLSALALERGPSAAQLAWLTEGQRGRKASAETRARMSAAHTGSKQSDETKTKMRLAWERRRAEGKVPGPLTSEQRAKITAAGMGRAPSAETRAKIARAAIGRKASEETKRILREDWVRRRQKANRQKSTRLG